MVGRTAKNRMNKKKRVLYGMLAITMGIAPILTSSLRGPIRR
jgi:hypothetical protein